MKIRILIVAIVLGFIAASATTIAIYQKKTYPYGWSHCCIDLMMFSLEQYAEEHGGHYPTGEVSPEASLSLLCRSNDLDAYTIRGMTVPEKTVRAILDGGGLLGPQTCGWHYTDGLTRADDSRLALLYCKQALGHNGQKTKDGGRQVVFVGANIEWISGEKWPAFLQEQDTLLSQRSNGAKSGEPLVDATIELPDGSQLGSIETSYTMQEQEAGTDGSSGNGKSGSSSLNRDAIVWFNTPLQHNYDGRITRTLLFSNLVSTPVTVTFSNGIPDKTRVIFKMYQRQ